jgi:hypothetical protein
MLRASPDPTICLLTIGGYWRAYHRTPSVKLARTIADLARGGGIQSVRLAEALQYRPKVIQERGSGPLLDRIAIHCGAHCDVGRNSRSVSVMMINVRIVLPNFRWYSLLSVYSGDNCQEYLLSVVFETKIYI